MARTDRRPKAKWLVAAAIVLALVAGVVLLSMRATEEAAPAQSDVPRRVGDAIEITPAFRAKAEIATTPAIRAPLTPLVKVVGAATFDPTHAAAVGTRAPGIVTKVLHVEGDTVEKGELLAEVESTSLVSAQADLRIATAKKHAATLDRDRERGLLDRSLTTAREYEQAEAALAEEKARSTAAAERVDALGGGGGVAGVSQLRAPVAGLVAERSVAPGQSVEPGLVAFRVGDLDELWVLLRVFERNIELVRVGDTVDIHKLSDSEESIHGTVAHVGSILDPTTRTADVRVQVANENRLLRPGQAVEATIRASGPARVALSVPQTAITFVDGDPTVFVEEAPQRFVARKVKVGLDGGDRIEILEGLHEGDSVVSRSVLALKSELFR